MPRITLPMAEWRAVLHQLAGEQTTPPPPGVVERIRALLAHAPSGWPEQLFALELDDSGAEAVRAVHTTLTDGDPSLGQHAASVAEAMGIIYKHQQHDDSGNPGGGVSR
jgi:hypothetical protein